MSLEQCDPEIYKEGETVAIVTGPGKQAIETFVQHIAEKSGQRVDWHYVGGRGVVKALGDIELVREVIAQERLIVSVYRDSLDSLE